MTTLKVIGVGNPFRRDDGVGVVVARELRSRGLGVSCLRGEMAELLEEFGEHNLVVDAIQHRSLSPGSVVRLSIEEVQKEMLTSTHGLGVKQAWEMAKILGKPPKSVLVIGVVGRDFSMGEGLSEEVAGVVPGVVKQIEEEIRCMKLR